MHDLNHPKVKPFTRAIGAEFRLPATFVNFILADEKPECFQFWCEDANHGWTCFIPDSIDHAYSLWSTGANQTLMLVSGSKHFFGRGHHDSPEIFTISQTSQGLLADLVNELYESEVSDQEILAAARFGDFQHLDEYLAFIESRRNSSEDWQPAWQRFIAKIDAKSLDL